MPSLRDAVRAAAAARVSPDPGDRGSPPEPEAQTPPADPAEDTADSAGTGKEPDGLLEKVVESGSDRSPWTREATGVFNDIRRSLPRDLGHALEFKNVECYARGCVLAVAYPSLDAYDASAQEFWSNSKLRTWKGQIGRTRTSSLPDGGVTVSWLLMNPDVRAN